jgi:hypothetical protein
LAGLSAFGDTVVLRDGASYSGRVGGPDDITFRDGQGVEYKFPRRDVHSLAFTATSATVTLNNGKSYTGQYTGANPLPFAGSGGIEYQFPLRDVEALVFSAIPKPASAEEKIISFGTEIAIRTDEPIDSKTSQPGQLYSATIVNQVPGTEGTFVIKPGTPAKLVVQQIKAGGAAGTPELILALFSVDVGGKEYRVFSSDAVEKGRAGVGANKRTLEFAGGGAGLGAMFGGIFGGGKGAGIGAASGAVAGGLTQLFTRGKEVKVPAEAELHFRLDQSLVLRPKR